MDSTNNDETHTNFTPVPALAAENKDSERCWKYMLWREENPNATMLDASEHFQISRAGLYKRLHLWEREGYIKRFRMHLLMPKAVAVQDAVTNIVDQWPQVLQSMMHDALHGNTAGVRRQAAKFLADIVTAQLEQNQESGSEELIYVSSDQDFTPTVIPQLKKKSS